MSRITQELMRKEANMMPLNFRERQAVMREFAGQYQRAGKRSKGQVLDQLEKLTLLYLKSGIKALMKCTANGHVD